MVEQVKKELRTPQGQFIFFAVLILLVGVAWFAQVTITSAAQSKKEIREIVFEIKGMAFGENNPPVYMQPGETIRFTIYNLDPGMIHNFAIEKTLISTELLKYGERATVDFTAPEQEEERDYFCVPHASMMRGKLIVTNEMVL